MEDLVTDSYPYWKAILWCFYPMTVLVLIELYSRLLDNNDDDDDDKDGGVMIPAYAAPS